MKKLICISFIFIFSYLMMFAQDIIVNQHGEEFSAKILEVTQTEVKFKKFDNLDGPIFTWDINEILLIKYENGINEVFSKQEITTTNIDQIIPEGLRTDMLYTELKAIYDYRMYEPYYADPYHPFVVGLASFFIPGLGQMITGEIGRGFSFLGGSVLSMIVSGIGAGMFTVSVNNYGEIVNPSTAKTGTFLMLTGLTAAATISIVGIVDAVKVAKVRNMYVQDLRSLSSFELKISPFIETASFSPDDLSTSIGLSLKVSF